MAQRNLRKQNAPDPLFNFSQRESASHQITVSDPSTTGQTHINYRTTGLYIPPPQPNNVEDMEVDSYLSDMTPFSDSGDEGDEDVDEVLGIKVVNKKLHAKRYINSVCSCNLSLLYVV